MNNFWNASSETGSSIQNRLKHKNVRGREANVNSIRKVHPRTDHDLDQIGNCMQLERSSNGTKSTQMTEVFCTNFIAIVKITTNRTTDKTNYCSNHVNQWDTTMKYVIASFG